MTTTTEELTDTEIINALKVAVDEHLRHGGRIETQQWGVHISEGKVIADSFLQEEEGDDSEGQSCLCLLGCLLMYPTDRVYQRVQELLAMPDYASTVHVQDWEGVIKRFFDALIGRKRTDVITQSFDDRTPVDPGSRHTDLALYAAETSRAYAKG